VPIVHVDDRPADLRSSAISGERAARELGWQVETPFHQGVRSYVSWVTGTHESPSVEPAARISGSASTVRRQEPAEL
ncbi:MAG: UDP-glucose 4-epimerase, partial [Gaiellaceae bacterium]|nr:UDP-glucose 4-epimerase [Gaiellaceae bacterium]